MAVRTIRLYVCDKHNLVAMQPGVCMDCQGALKPVDFKRLPKNPPSRWCGCPVQHLDDERFCSTCGKKIRRDRAGEPIWPPE